MPVVVQRLIAVVALVVLMPLLGALAIAVRTKSGSPILHRAVRVRPGGTFTLYKFRTMDANQSGPGVTSADDPRITTLGRFLRRTKLDELPQLWNVVKGEMLLVGPRPEDPGYVDWADPLHRFVYSALPGITGPTALVYRDEEQVLAREMARTTFPPSVPWSERIDNTYRHVILPQKVAMDAAYLRSRSTRGDLLILARTISGLLRHRAFG
jgi:lipopolysaccharide/colanic/teichoic acid biosynthesis glycosyltransferase